MKISSVGEERPSINVIYCMEGQSERCGGSRTIHLEATVGESTFFVDYRRRRHRVIFFLRSIRRVFVPSAS
jgi:hypothetical protein